MPSIPDPDMPAPDSGETREATPYDCALLQQWTESFKFANARQVVRLRNSYLLLAKLNQKRRLGHKYEDTFLLVMLFWVEFINQYPVWRRRLLEMALLGEKPIIADIPHAKNKNDRDKFFGNIVAEVDNLNCRILLVEDHLKVMLPEAEKRSAEKNIHLRDRYDMVRIVVSRFVLPAGN